MTTLPGALRGALDDVINEIVSGRLGQVDLSMFRRDNPFRTLRADILAYLGQATGGRIFAGDSRLFKHRAGIDLYFVYVPRPDPSNPVRPEYQPDAKCLYLAPTPWGLYDMEGPADKATLTRNAPEGLPPDYILPGWVK